MKKKSKGITLIALVITIIILLILAGISIANLNNNGILEKAKDSEEKSQMSNAKESILLALNAWNISNLTEEISLENFLNANIPNNEIDSFEIKGNNTYKLYKNEYFLIVDSNGTILEDIQKDENVPTINNIKFTTDGSSEIEDNSLSLKTPITINFTPSIKYGTIKSISPSIPYTTNGTELEKKFTIIVTIDGIDYTKTVTISVKNKYKIVTGKLVDAVNNKDINIGDYVKYTPTTANTDNILNELNLYSGSTNNTISTLKQENLNWKVFDVKDNKVRLISEFPTESKISLYGYIGYNNVVKLLDDTCNTLYNSNLANHVQNLKIEDIEDKMIETNFKNINSKYGTKFKATYKNYPSIFAKEQYQTVNGKTGTELNLSEQTNLLNQKSSITASSLEAQWTTWSKTMNETDYKKSIYHNIFTNNDSEYFLSSRCIAFGSYAINFNISYMLSDKITFKQLCNSYNVQLTVTNAFRPIITLNSNVEVDTENSGNGDSVIHAYAIK